MGFAEKKVELFQIVADADEEMTGKLIEFARQLQGKSEKFSAEELAEFNRRRDEYLKNPEMGISMEASMAQIRNQLVK